MVKKAYVPDAGDIAWLNFDPRAGREHARRRPALVLTAVSYNQASGLAVVCPFTSVRKNYPFEIPEVVAGRDAVLLADHVKSLDWRTRHAAFIEKAGARLLQKTRAYLAVLLGMTTSH